MRVHFQRCIAAIIFSVSASLLLPSAASAVTETVNFADCRSTLDGASINVTTGNDVRITFTSCNAAVTNTLFLAANSPVGSSSTVDINGARFVRQFDGGRWRIDGYGVSGASNPLPEGAYPVFFRLYDNFNNVELFAGDFTVNVTPPASQDSLPAPIMQQFGSPTSGTCNQAAAETLNWSGVESGGWSDSWAEWMSGGLGGSVCTRTLHYVANTATWVAR